MKNTNEMSYFYLQELLRTTETNATKWLSNLPNYARFNCVIVSHLILPNGIGNLIVAIQSQTFLTNFRPISNFCKSKMFLQKKVKIGKYQKK